MAAIYEKYPKARCVGVDISLVQIKKAKTNTQNISFIVGDISNLIINKKFDIIILRDVVEHLNNVKEVLSKVVKMLRLSGMIFISFPPYFSPFGGHQQNNLNIIAKLPYIHYLPGAIYFKIANPFLEEIYKDLRKNRLTIGKMDKLVDELNLRILKRELYLFRPVFRLRYGLPTIKIHGIDKIPLFRELATTGAFYFLSR